MKRRGRLVRKYVVIMAALVSGGLVASGAVETYFSYQENRAALVSVQKEKALAAAVRIEGFVKEIERQMGWTTQPLLVAAAAALEQRRIDYLRLLRQVPAITELSHIDRSGKEQLRISRLAMDVIGSQTDVSGEPRFREPRGGRTWFGPVYFRKGSEPYMTIAMPESGGGVTAAEVNLKFIWDVVSRITIGKAGRAYVVDGGGNLIAHPDISLVLQKTSLATLSQVKAAIATPARPDRLEDDESLARDLHGRQVLTAWSTIPTLRWTVFAEQPLAEAFEPLYASLKRTALLIALGVLGSVVAGVVLARRMVRPIATLGEGAARIAAGELGHQIDVRTGDELEALAGEFNRMAAQLQDSYATLEQKVVERTRALTEALEQQTATSEILRVISSSPTDVRPVFDAVAERAARLCGAVDALILRVDGGMMYRAAHFGGIPSVSEMRAVTRDTPSGRAIIERRPIHIADILEEFARGEYLEARALHEGTGFRTVLVVPLVREDAVVGVITIRRLEPRPFSDKQVELVKTFADQAAIAVENVRLFTELQEKNRAVTEALEQQTATSEILGVISGSPTDVQPVFDAIAESSVRLCGAVFGSVYRFDGELIHMVADYNYSPEALEVSSRLFPAPPGRRLFTARSILDRAVVHVPDVEQDAEYGATGTIVGLGFRSTLAVPMLREGKPIGAITVWRAAVGPFSDKHIALLRTFADQAVIAVENVRLFTELQEKHRVITEALEQQTATSEILRVISSSPTDVQPVFDAVAENAARLCNASDATILRARGDRLWPVAARGAIPTSRTIRDQGVPIVASTVAGRAALERRVVHVEDLAAAVQTDFPDSRPYQADVGHRTILVVPLVRDAECLGVIVIRRLEVQPFTDTQVDLLQTFADQAVIAIENVRLFTEREEKNRAITEALEQQTATSEILRVISSSPTDVQPVFDTIVHRAKSLLNGFSAFALRVVRDEVHLAAETQMSGDTAEVQRALKGLFPCSLASAPLLGLVVRERRPYIVSDTETDPLMRPEVRPIQRARGYRSQLFVPIVREDEVVGLISVTRPEPGTFTADEIGVLATFADQAVIAIENVRLFTELEERTRELARTVDQLTALADVGRAVSSTLDLDQVLHTIVARASELAGTDGGSIYEYDEAVEVFRLRASQNVGIQLMDAQRDVVLRKGEGVVGRLAEQREPVQVADIVEEHEYRSPLRDALVRSGYRALLAVPLLHEDRVVGGLVVSRKAPGAFAAETVELLKTFAAQSALAIQNARLFRALEEKSRELEIANRHKSEFLANMSHELRTPLNAIIGFSEVLVERMFGELTEKQDEYLRDIYASGRHLLSLINDILDLSKIEAGRMDLELSTFDLPQAIQNALTLVRGRADAHGIRLDFAVDPRLGDFVGDERKVKQIVVNLLSNAVKFTPAGGRVSVRAVQANGTVEVSVADTGIGIAPEDHAAVFEEFRQVGTDYARKREGTGLGLALTKRFVELHGGSIGLKSAPGEGSTFTFTLPVRTWPTT